MINEFRRDPISGSWTLIAPGRSGRPQNDGTRDRLVQAKEQCVFESAKLEGNELLLAYDHGRPMPWHGDWFGRWTTVAIPNKYPALFPGTCAEPTEHGPFLTHPAHGFHELVITRDHERQLADLTTEECAEVFMVFRDRFRVISESDCGEYIYICHNFGRAAGASILHNHTQIFTSPVVPPGVMRALSSPVAYQTVIDWEKSEGTRMVYENDLCIVFCPFASRVPYEMRVFPKTRLARFEESSPELLTACADAFGTVLKKLNTVLDHPDYNFFIHTAPAKDRSHDMTYNWHIEILPRAIVVGAFEMSTDIYINPSDPDACAEQLRKA